VTTLQIGDDELHYESHGDGRPVVFLHGGWASAAMWADQTDRFSDDYRVVTLDLPGHGRTGPTDDRVYSIDGYTETLRAVLEALDIAEERPVLCGLSLGGLVAQTYLSEYDGLGGVVLSSTIRTVPPVPLTQLQKYVLMPKPAVYATIRTMGVRRYYDALLRSIRAIEGHQWLALDREVRRYARTEVGEYSEREYIKVMDALYEYRPQDISATETPSLVLAGDHEASTVRAQNRRIAEMLDAPFVTVPDAGHLVNMDNTAAFDAALDEFLGGVAG